MITLLRRFWHESVLHHGRAWVEAHGGGTAAYRYGVLIECTCGKRWLSRAPWDRADLL